jgi:hypothetical protein
MVIWAGIPGLPVDVVDNRLHAGRNRQMDNVMTTILFTVKILKI